MRDLKKKQIRHCNIIPSDLLKWVFMERKKTISLWKRRSGRNGIAPTGKKCAKNLKKKTFSNFQQHRFQILIKTESGSS